VRRAIASRPLHRLTLSLAVIASAMLALCAGADADVFGPISLVSASPFQQVEYAHDPAISGDGRYVVFDGSIGGVTGVWRRENRPEGNLVQVAGGDAELPSISENGQFVSFTTNEGAHLEEVTDGLPDPEHFTHEAPNVYVRNMQVAPGEGGAFTLASPLSYEYSGGSPEEEREHLGSEAAGRSAISADGNKVVFVTTAASDLDGPGTPPLQVAVHDLQTGATEPVSVEDDPATGLPATEGGRPKPVQLSFRGGTEFGAAYVFGEPFFRARLPYTPTSGVGASISADGSAVAWMAQDVGEQARTLPGEELQGEYSEPLWRRVGAGEQAPTRRVTGGSDPSNPACQANPESRLPRPASAADPCQGPFATIPTRGVWTGAGNVPQLSANGEMVAFVGNAALVSQGSGFGESGGGDVGRPGDLYVVNMREGLSRTQALTKLTEISSGDITDVADDASILEPAISSDGEQIAFTSRRTVFPLGTPAYVSALAAVPGMGELYEVDLANETLTRVTQSDQGGPGEHPHLELGEVDPYREGDGALSPSFADNGALLAFSSTASNLVFGDGNTPPVRGAHDGTDAFVVEREVFSPMPTPQAISPAPAGPALAVAWRLGVTARTLSDGKVILYVTVPGAGQLRAAAASAVAVPGAGPAHGARNRRTGRPAAHGAATKVLTRTVASAKRAISPMAGGLTTLLLTLGHSYTALASRHGGLSATVTVSFSSAGHPLLRQRLTLSFARKRSARKASAHKAGRSSAPVHGSRP
jgi:WD40-like Beta Propeller Repeat